MILDVRDVSLSFSDTVLFAGLTFSVDAGETVALVGPSGTGKSTVLACIAGLVRPSSGAITVAGKDVTSADEERRAEIRRAHIANAFQDPHLLEELNVRENVELPARFRGAEPRRARRRAERALADVGALHLADRWTGDLSGGEAQRVALARALATGCEVILADEPTASLDRATAASVADVLLSASRHDGAAIVVATHDPMVAERCDRIVELGSRVRVEPVS